MPSFPTQVAVTMTRIFLMFADIKSTKYPLTVPSSRSSLYQSNLSTMSLQRHWFLRSLAVVAIAFWYATDLVNKMPIQDFCNHTKTPPVVLAIAKWATICRPETKTFIPTILTTTEVNVLAPLAGRLPDPTEMIKNRIGIALKIFVFSRWYHVVEIGKISAALDVIGTPESQLTMDAIENYDQQAKKTIRSLASLSYQSRVSGPP